MLRKHMLFWDVLVGYFRTSGFFRLYPALESVEHIRILVGLNVDRFMLRNRWMVDHSNLVIAYYNGSEGGAQKTIEYAEELGIRTVIGGVEAIGNLSG